MALLNNLCLPFKELAFKGTSSFKLKTNGEAMDARSRKNCANFISKQKDCPKLENKPDPCFEWRMQLLGKLSYSSEVVNHDDFPKSDPT